MTFFTPDCSPFVRVAICLEIIVFICSTVRKRWRSNKTLLRRSLWILINFPVFAGSSMFWHFRLLKLLFSVLCIARQQKRIRIYFPRQRNRLSPLEKKKVVSLRHERGVWNRRCISCDLQSVHTVEQLNQIIITSLTISGFLSWIVKNTPTGTCFLKI